MPKVVLEAIFRETGLDKLGRAFDGIAQKMKRMADVQKSWGGGAVGDEQVRRQFRIGAELDNVQGKIRSATKTYTGLLTELDKTNDPKRRADLQNRMGTVERFAARELALQEKLNKAVTEEGAAAGRSAMIRRGIKLGLATLGVPYTIAGIARGLGEANEQSRMVSPLAQRMVGTSGSGGPGGMRDFTDYSMRLRENIVDTGAAFAYSGRESIQLADTLLTMSGSMKGFRESLEAARTLGLSPQATTQLIGTARRFGGTGGNGQMTEEKFANLIVRGISDSGMGPRGAEYIQSIVSTMQQYSTRLPNVDPGAISSIIEAINQQAGRAGAATLKGSGALQVTQGITGMMDDMSEAMIAVQTQIISRNQDKYASAAKKYGISGPLQGTAAYGLALALKQEGIAGNDGMRLAGDTIKMILGSQDVNTRKIMESTLLRLPMTMIQSLEAGGKNSFMEKFLNGQISSDEMMRRAGGANSAMAMQTPGMAWSHVGASVSAASSSVFSAMLPDPNTVNAFADIIDSRLPSATNDANEAEHRRKRLLRFGGQMATGVGAITSIAGAPWVGAPLMMTGLEMARRGYESNGRTSSGESLGAKEINHILDIRITAKEDFNGIASGIAKLASQIMHISMKEEAKKSQEVSGMSGSTDLNNVKYGSGK